MTGVFVRSDAELKYYYKGKLYEEYWGVSSANLIDTNILLGEEH